MRVMLVAGARPNFMKIAPIFHAAAGLDDIECLIVHTGQHYDYEMSQAFFADLQLPEPDFFLEAGSGSHAVQTAKIMVAFEEVCRDQEPDLVMVVGDVNSTLACSIVAKKMLIGVAHVEAGLRSFDLEMPEEINRMVTDAISDYFFVTEQSGVDNLLREGKPEKNVHLVGHVMIDNLLRQVALLDIGGEEDFATGALKKSLGEYLFLTLHRPANVDDREVLSGIVSTLNEISSLFPIIFPVHPRTRKMIDHFGLELAADIHQLPPLGFRESLFWWRDAVMVLTDSGGLQEETTALKIPCITLRENTERPITVEMGSNVLAGNRPSDILAAFEQVLASDRRRGRVPPLWDGKSAERIWAVVRGSG
ncbi:MAG: UDP-N-acetylglucosamine 2-epimerase (non-hydrolyzing) [Pseudomonadota bacterium]|nr:UDP-N-acetylglucosamine 2-epimerase (non-hydrolyzing) [Pseudomonadota bacterium]